MRTALIGINLQLDFFPGGGLNLENNPVQPATIQAFAERYSHRYLVCDHHPANHISFAGNHLWRYPGQLLETDEKAVRLWLIHAVGGSFGAELHPAIQAAAWSGTFYKGQDPAEEQLSGWQATDAGGKTLAQQLREEDIERVLLAGMCRDFDLAETARDTREAGLETVILTDLSFPAEPEEGYAKRVEQQLEQAGINYLSHTQVEK